MLLTLCTISGSALAADAAKSKRAVQGLRAAIEKAGDKKVNVADAPFTHVALTKADSAAARKLLWNRHVERVRRTRQKEMDAKSITIGEHTMRFAYRVFGEKPKDGRSLYISMHGGGGTAARVNDQQWRNQIGLYRPKEGVYLAPRAPTNTWNLWHQAHIDVFFDRLIENLVVLEDVNPNRVYIMGYSAGGDGVYQLAPRMADRWAAASMMAGHPNETQPQGLRNIGFAIHVGEKDGGYKRNEKAREWKVKLAELHKKDPGGYKHVVKLHKGMGHWMNRQDREALPWMATFTRNPFPDHVVWRQDNVTHGRFYWLAVDEANRKKGVEVVADYVNETVQEVTVKTADIQKVTVLLNDRMFDLDKPVVVKFGGTTVRGPVPRTIANLSRTLDERRDPDLVFSGRVDIERR